MCRLKFFFAEFVIRICISCEMSGVSPLIHACPDTRSSGRGRRAEGSFLNSHTLTQTDQAPSIRRPQLRPVALYSVRRVCERRERSGKWRCFARRTRLFEKRSSYFDFKLRVTQRSGMENNGDKGAVGIAERNAENENRPDFLDHAAIEQPDFPAPRRHVPPQPVSRPVRRRRQRQRHR
jgi:hypothetical protein